MKILIRSSERRHRAGFTLAELLLTIALISITASVAIMALSRVVDTATQESNRTNAQRASSVCNAAVSAGATVTGDSVDEILDQLLLGVQGRGANATSFFQFSLSGSQRDAARPWLTVENGLLIYQP